MIARFIRAGGWELGMDVPDANPPIHWVYPVPIKLSTRAIADVDLRTAVQERLVFRLEEFQDARGDHEWIYVEDGVSTFSVKPHECVPLGHALRRIDELERLCEQAAELVQAAGQGAAFMTALTGGPNVNLDLD